MRRWWMIALGPGILAFSLGTLVLMFVFVLLLVKLLWAWTVPDILPGAVEQGLVAGSVSWLTALKIAIFLAVLASVSGMGGKGGRK